MSTADRAMWPDEPVPAGVTPGPREEANDEVVPRAEFEDLDDRLRRALAELDNNRKRSARQADESRWSARVDAAALLVPIVDNLDRAAAAAAEACESHAVVEGVAAVRDQAVSVLEKLGFRRHAEVGVPFDPYLHEAVGVRHDVVAEPGTVVEVVRAGYGEGERQLRPAGVVVAGQQG